MSTGEQGLTALSGCNPRQAIERLYATGHWLLAQSRERDAIKVFRVLLLCAPEEERSWLALGSCHERLGETHMALELFGSGALVSAPAPRCWLAKARVLRALERDADALEALGEARAAGEDACDDLVLAMIQEESKAS